MAHPSNNAAIPMELSGGVLNYINLHSGETVLQLGRSGRKFIQQISAKIGPQGTVFVLPSITSTSSPGDRGTESNPFPQVAILKDISGWQIPLKDATVDWVFMVNILHWYYYQGELNPVFKEIRRIHKPGGKLIVVECEPVPGTPGPPLEMRIPSSQMNSIVYPNGYFLYDAWPLNNFMFVGYYKRQPMFEPWEDETLGN